MRSCSVDVAEYCRRREAADAVDDSADANERSEWRLAAIMIGGGVVCVDLLLV